MLRLAVYFYLQNLVIAVYHHPLFEQYGNLIDSFSFPKNESRERERERALLLTRFYFQLFCIKHSSVTKNVCVKFKGLKDYKKIKPIKAPIS